MVPSKGSSDTCCRPGFGHDVVIVLASRACRQRRAVCLQAPMRCVCGKGLVRTPPARCLRSRAWLGTVSFEDCEARFWIGTACLQVRSGVARAWYGRRLLIASRNALARTHLGYETRPRHQVPVRNAWPTTNSRLCAAFVALTLRILSRTPFSNSAA